MTTNQEMTFTAERPVLGAIAHRDATRGRRPHSLAGRLLLFLPIAYAFSWWPWPLSDLGSNPDAALMIPIGPSIAALIVVLWCDGRAAARAVLRSLLHVRLGRWWLALFIPVLIAGSAASLAVLAGAPAPGGSDVVEATFAGLVTLPVLLVIGGPLGEEIGWRGFVLPSLLERFGPIAATLVLTPMWLAFHLPWILNKPDQYGVPWALAVLGMSLTMTWLWLRTGGSLAMAVVFHAVVNASTAAAIQLFPEADRPLAWGIAATLWLATGVATASRLVSPPGHARSARRRVSTMVARHPLAWFFTLAFGIAWSALVPAVALGLPLEPFHLAANFGGLLGSAVLVTAVVGGRSGVRDLFQRVFRWRFRWPPVTAAALGLPIATVVMAAVAGSLRSPVGGWPEMVTAYLVATVTGLLLFNLWEETAWAGFVQRRLTDRHGVLRGALLTSVPFAAIHLPLVFVDRPTSVEVAINVAALMVVAVAFRFLAGVVLAGARGSVLAVALVHASFNASGGLPGVTGGWESVVGLAVVTAFASSLWLRGQARVPK